MPLKPEELEIVREVGFDVEIAERLREHTRSSIERVVVQSFVAPPTDGPGLSIAVKDGDAAEKLINEIRPLLEPRGYRSFWSKRHEPNGMVETDEVVILNTSDPYAIVRLRLTDGANYGISHEDVLNGLKEWEGICAFAVVGADHDWVALVFTRLPERICRFAEQAYAFCPDSVEQGVGLRREEQDPELFAAARRLCPEVSVKTKSTEEILAQIATLPPEQANQLRGMLELAAAHSTPSEMGVRLLAHEISRTKYLFLWWD